MQVIIIKVGRTYLLHFKCKTDLDFKSVKHKCAHVTLKKEADKKEQTVIARGKERIERSTIMPSTYRGRS